VIHESVNNLISLDRLVHFVYVSLINELVKKNINVANFL